MTILKDHIRTIHHLMEARTFSGDALAASIDRLAGQWSGELFRRLRNANDATIVSVLLQEVETALALADEPVQALLHEARALLIDYCDHYESYGDAMRADADNSLQLLSYVLDAAERYAA